jgi:hypothetical protein
LVVGFLGCVISMAFLQKKSASESAAVCRARKYWPVTSERPYVFQ